MTTPVDLLDTFRAHLASFKLPAVCSVTVNTGEDGPEITVRLACYEPPQIAAALLAWADTLTEITVEAWRVPSGDYVYLSLIGQLTADIGVRLYGAMAFAGRGLGGDLAPDARRPVPLAVLYAIANPGEVSA